MPFRIDVLSIFDPNLVPTWPPKLTNIHEKSMSRWLPILTSFFNRFLIDFYSQLQPPEPSKSLLFHKKKKTSFFRKIAFRSLDLFLMRFWCQLGSILPPQIHQIRPKIDLKRHQNFDRFWLPFFLDFGSVLAAKLEPCWPPFSAQDRPRGLQDGPRCPAGTRYVPTPGTMITSERPKMAQDAPKIDV